MHTTCVVSAQFINMQILYKSKLNANLKGVSITMSNFTMYDYIITNVMSKRGNGMCHELQLCIQLCSIKLKLLLYIV